MTSALSKALIFIITNLGALYIGAVMLRFLLQTARADFYNPVCQAIVKVSSPLLNPLRRIIPSWRRLDIASLVLALILNTLATAAMVFLLNATLPIGKLVSWSAVGLIGLTLNLYFYAMVVSVVASFIAPVSGHPILLVIFQLLQPFYRLAHRVIPPMGGLDFSPLLLILTIKVVEILILTPLIQGLGIQPVVVIGL